MKPWAWIAALLLVSCSGGESGLEAPLTTDGESGPEAPPTGDDIAATDPVLGHPHDGRLHAAAAAVVITPNADNHPCPLYMGGTGMNRIAEGVHDDLEARVLVLARDDVHVVVASMDLVGLEAPDTIRMQTRIAALGLDPGHLLISCTHTHSGPDTIGVWGPEDGVTGRCPAYHEFLADALGQAVADLRGTLRPVTIAAGEVSVNEPLSNEPSLLRDSRQPVVINNRITAARLATPEGETVATLVNWHNHPEAMIEHDVFSADFPRWTRRALEEAWGGTAIYLSGTVGGLMTPIDVTSRRFTEDGQPVLGIDGTPEMITGGGEEQAWSFGYLVAEYAQAALAGAPAVDTSFSVDVSRIEVPVDSFVLIATFQSGVLEGHPGLVTDAPDRCGVFGCLPVDLHHLRLGDLHLVSFPGEVFPESSVGRPETIVDWGEEAGPPWTPWTYPAMEGFRASLPQGALLMELGLTNQEVGYVVPATDILPANHPDNYEEYFNISPRAEALIREAVASLLAED
ncbi:MAG: hypothetical protein ABIK09_20755 [Pseudomonadota bacterium]